MPLSPDILADNAAQLQRLEAVVASLADRNLDLGSGWTVSVALAHLTFWDRRAALFLDCWGKHGTAPDEHQDADILNAALLDEWRLLTVRHAGELAISAARAVDAAVEALDGSIADAIAAAGYRLNRGRHRREHLNQIERALSRS